jgi:hypothetical protein
MTEYVAGISEANEEEWYEFIERCAEKGNQSQIEFGNGSRPFREFLPSP